MSVLQNLATKLDNFSQATGKLISWMTLLMVIITFSVVVLRYAFNLGWIWLQESIIYLHAWVFMLGAAYTLQAEGHVRIDVFYRDMSHRGRAWVNLLGSLLLLTPMCAFIAWSSWQYVDSAWAVREASPEAGGLPWVYILKSSLILMPLLIFLQGLALILQSLTALTTKAEQT